MGTILRSEFNRTIFCGTFPHEGVAVPHLLFFFIPIGIIDTDGVIAKIFSEDIPEGIFL